MSIQLLTNQSFHGARPVLDLLSEALGKLPMPNKRQHVLCILSCYVRPLAIKQIIDGIAAQVRLTMVRILFDYSEVFTHGPSNLQREFDELRESVLRRHGIALEWKAIRPKSGALVHAKAYAVAEINSKREIESGCLFFGSANATHRGLGLAARSNIELGSVVTSRDELESFCFLFEELWEHETVSMDSDLARDQEELLQFALLRSGCFLVKWSGNLKSQLSVRYKLTDSGRRAILVRDKELIARGFEAEHSSLTKNYLRLPRAAARRDFPRAFSSNYTIESLLGRFCPGPIWDVVTQERRSEDDAFLAGIVECLNPEQLAAAMEEAQKDLAILRKRRMVDCGTEHLESWQDRMVSLRENPKRLLRVRRMFSDFLLPYAREDVDSIKELFDSLLESIRFAKRKNVAMRHFVAAVDAQSLGPLELDEEEAAELRQLFKAKRSKRLRQKRTRR